MFRFIRTKRTYKNQFSGEVNRLLLRIGKKTPRGIDVKEIENDPSTLVLMNAGLIRINEMENMKKTSKLKNLRNKGLINIDKFYDLQKNSKFKVYDLTETGRKEYNLIRNK